VEKDGKRFWLSEQKPSFNDSIFAELSKKDKEKLLGHIRFPGDREAIFGRDALIPLAMAEHDLNNWSGLKVIKENLPPGAEALILAFQKDGSAESARKACLAWAYSAALAEWLAAKLPEAKLSDEAAGFLSDILFSGPVSMRPDDALSAVKTVVKEFPGSKPLESVLSLYRKTCSLRFQSGLKDYYTLAEKSSGKSRKVRELYLKGVEAYANEDYRTALFYWKEVLKIDPKHEDAKKGAEKAEKMLGR
ncbi:MAG: hypothetical protein ACPL68_06725, partial [Candidatus Hydrothermia bacterium]